MSLSESYKFKNLFSHEEWEIITKLARSLNDPIFKKPIESFWRESGIRQDVIEQFFNFLNNAENDLDNGNYSKLVLSSIYPYIEAYTRTLLVDDPRKRPLKILVTFIDKVLHPDKYIGKIEKSIEFTSEMEEIVRSILNKGDRKYDSKSIEDAIKALRGDKSFVNYFSGQGKSYAIQIIGILEYLERELDNFDINLSKIISDAIINLDSGRLGHVVQLRNRSGRNNITGRTK